MYNQLLPTVLRKPVDEATHRPTFVRVIIKELATASLAAESISSVRKDALTLLARLILLRP